MRIYSALIAALFFVGGMATVKIANAATPKPGTNMTAMCAKGFTASPGTYTQAQLSGAGVKYSCSMPWNGKGRAWPAGFVFTCSNKFSHLTNGADAPSTANGKATYFCISSGPN